jgi:prevent-host-death family protein
MIMPESFTLTAAKARLSDLIGRLIHRREKIFITRKGKSVAVLLSLDEYKKLAESDTRGLLAARGVLAGRDEEVAAMTEAILAERAKERGREVPL